MKIKTSNFTPGPWTYEIVPYNDQERAGSKEEWTGLYIGPLDEETGRIAKTIFEGGFSHGPEDGCPEDDARLMAAAPDIYEALREIVQISDRKHNAWAKAHAALARACGDERSD